MDSENNNGITSQNVNEQGKEEDQEATALQRTFRSQGWNVAGANLLALSCWQAKSVYMYFRLVDNSNDYTFASKNCPSYMRFTRQTKVEMELRVLGRNLHFWTVLAQAHYGGV